MTNHEDQDYRRSYPLANINKGPGTKALLNAKPGDMFTFEGTALGDCEFYLGVPRQLAEAQHLGADNWVLWLNDDAYPRYVERIAYNGHNRKGLSECWEMQLRANATAEEKADHADAGSTMMLPVSALWMMAIIFGSLGLMGFHYGSPVHPLAGMLIIFWVGAPFWAVVAIWKQDRDRFWRALDVINSLDLRRPPEEIN